MTVLDTASMRNLKFNIIERRVGDECSLNILHTLVAK
jgi:hypothetical protein